ncbi:MAG: class II glutamine amidotransferase [archaeon]
MRRVSLILIVLLLPAVLAIDHNCRMWAAVGNTLDAQQQLLEGGHSLKQLGQYNRNGWGMVSYTNQTNVYRGILPASEDTAFDNAAMNISGNIIIAHVRACSSGCCDIADPHPFVKTFRGKTWSLAHNGNINKDVLFKLIDDAYLQDHPVQTCPDNPIDSELYFIYLEKLIEETNGNVEDAIFQATTTLMQYGQSTLNILFSDGTTLWAYKQGNTLYYTYDIRQGKTFVASEPLNSGWTALEDGQLLIIREGEFPLIMDTQERPPAPEPSTPIVEQSIDDATKNIIMITMVCVMLLMLILMIIFMINSRVETHKKPR